MRGSFSIGGQRNPNLNQRFSNVPAQDKIVCSIVRAELYYGVYKSQRPQANLLKIDSFVTRLPSLPFDDQAARVYGILWAELELKGLPIGTHDLQIAAIALVNHLTLVTHNTREFGRVTNLLIEDWEI